MPQSAKEAAWKAKFMQLLWFHVLSWRKRLRFNYFSSLFVSVAAVMKQLEWDRLKMTKAKEHTHRHTQTQGRKHSGYNGEDPPGEGALPLSVVCTMEAIYWKISSHTDWEMTEPACFYWFSILFVERKQFAAFKCLHEIWIFTSCDAQNENLRWNSALICFWSN